MKPALHEALREQLRVVSSDSYAKVQDPEQWESLCRCTRALLASVEQGPRGEQLASIAQRLEAGQGKVARMKSAAELLRWCMTHEAKASAKDKPKVKAPVQRSALRKSPQKRNRSPEQTAQHKDDPRLICVSTLKGIGPKTAQKLQERGLGRLGDLLYLVPSAYLDRRHKKSPEQWVQGEQVVVSGKIQDFRQSFFRGRYIAKLTMLVDAPEPVSPTPNLAAATGKVPAIPDAGQAGAQESAQGADSGDRRLELRWFHRVGGLGNRVETGTPVTAVGALSIYKGQWSMIHPEIARDAETLDGIGVHYPAVKGVPAKTLQKACQQALINLEQAHYPDPIPARFCRDYPSQFEALKALHAPDATLEIQDVQDLNHGRSLAHRRLAFDECFYLQLAAMRRRQAWQAQTPTSSPLCQAGLEPEQLRACLPFEPTKAQWRCIQEIEQDLQGQLPMLRLLQGDVGAGKTVVAFAAAMMSVQAKAQVALMAPTEILAKQHAASLAAWCERAGIRMALLTGSSRRAERESLLALLEAGSIDLLIGTHALLVESVRFARLGLVIVDEQHRFGVEQRAALREKGTCPHLLVMTATPIPRSLALTAYGEMEISVLDEMPPGRTPSVTRLYAGPRALAAARMRLVKAVLEKDLLAFVVCPLVEKSEALEVSDVYETAKALGELVDPELLVCVHGRMSGPEKDAAMETFRSGKAKILVATTVIEVGVDVPNARVMLVEHAERFGLAQLHQLRGRIGRGGGPSLCMLHTASAADTPATRRLAVMEASHDGFAVAEHDLAQRGPGEVFGVRQSGVPKLRFASFRKEGLGLLQEARDAAAQLLRQDPELLDHPDLLRELALRSAGQGQCSTQAG